MGSSTSEYGIGFRAALPWQESSSCSQPWSSAVSLEDFKASKILFLLKRMGPPMKTEKMSQKWVPLKKTKKTRNEILSAPKQG